PTASVEAPATISVGPAPSLSPRELEVARLVALGRSNREIGGELSISTATVERHVANIMTKLAFRSRAQIAAWVVAQQRSRERPAIAGARLDRSTFRPVPLGAD
ncbi:MAG TPA: helix-turn-helix transcriptional regulator, partial [Thermomicrobiales bacterium]|nr:helix-turn-helix transcriptional regulator [Thermomicrobiales bacterium]